MAFSFGSVSELSARTGFAGNPLDRLSERRDDDSYARGLRADPSSRVALLRGEDFLLLRRADAYEAFFSFAEASAIGRLADVVLLGRTAERALFAAQLAPSEDRVGADGARRFDHGALAGGAELQTKDLRSVAVNGAVDGETLGVLAQAKSLVHWHARHRFCANCGRPTASAAAGWRRECAACGALHFPRTDPVVIMVATDGESCLLGRQPRFPPGMYSALAGFLEPGETVENAVRREVREETGVRVGRVSYLASQPWPFPSSLMLGCVAEALTRDIRLDGAELEDARWFARTELRAMFAQDHPDGLRAPNPIAIAHRLLAAWLET